MAKLFKKDAKEILALVNTIPGPKPLDIDRAKVAAITCKSTKEFCDFLELDVISFKHWCNNYPDYHRAVLSWRNHATNEIEVAMAKRAIGFTKTTKRDVLTKLGTVKTLSVETYYPPSETAGQFWLKNRKPEDWQDKKEIDVNVNANIRAWLVSAGGAMDPSEVIEGVSNLIENDGNNIIGNLIENEVNSLIEDNTQAELEAELISDLIEEVNSQEVSDFNKSDGTEGVSDFNLVVNNNPPDLVAAAEPENNSSVSPGNGPGPSWQGLNAKWT